MESEGDHMKGYRCRGTITVFLSLVSVLILSLVCTLVESARVQGARAWAGAVTDMGLFSVFGEYEKEILEKYDVLFLDVSRESGDFEPERIAWRAREFMEYNSNPEKGLKRPAGRNLFPMELADCQATGYVLAADEQGSAFYQQVVGSIRENMGTELFLQYQEHAKKAKEQKENAESYSKKDKAAWTELEALEKEQEKNRELKSGEEPERNPEENPLKEIRKIKKRGILGLVVKDVDRLSGKSIQKEKLPSGRTLQKGNLPVEKKYQGVLADGIFQDYLLEHFGTWSAPCKEGALEYQAEYILAGKAEDQQNLKAVVNRLLLMREGTNLVCLLRDEQKKGEARALAVSIAGAVPIPGLVPALEAALLLAWAYGESLLDVRTLLSGGRVSLVKNVSEWKLSLGNLAKVTELLSACDQGGGEGASYVDYLRILMLSGGKEKFPLRALDMMESTLSSGKADAWVIKAQLRTSWRFPPVFLRVPAAFLNVSGQTAGYEVEGSFGY